MVPRFLLVGREDGPTSPPPRTPKNAFSAMENELPCNKTVPVKAFDLNEAGLNMERV